MHMIGHQTPRVHSYPQLFLELRQGREVTLVIGAVSEARFLIVAALDDMMRIRWQYHSRDPWHRPPPAENSNRQILLYFVSGPADNLGARNRKLNPSPFENKSVPI
jgi:hypothetical protein